MVPKKTEMIIKKIANLLLDIDKYYKYNLSINNLSLKYLYIILKKKFTND